MLAGTARSVRSSSPTGDRAGDVDRRRAVRVAALITRRRRGRTSPTTRTCREDLEEAAELALGVRPVGSRAAPTSTSVVLLLDLGDLTRRDRGGATRRSPAASASGRSGGSGGFACGNLCRGVVLRGRWDEAAATPTPSSSGRNGRRASTRASVPDSCSPSSASSADGAPTRRSRVRRGISSRWPGAKRRPVPSSRLLAVRLDLRARRFDGRSPVDVDELLARRRAPAAGVAPGCWTVASRSTLERLGCSARDCSPLPRARARGSWWRRGRSTRATPRQGRRPCGRSVRGRFEAECRVLAARDATRRARRRLAEAHADVRASFFYSSTLAPASRSSRRSQEPQRRKLTAVAPRASQSVIPPSTTGRAS